MSALERKLYKLESMLKEFENQLAVAPAHWATTRVKEGAARARAELVKAHNEIWWKDEDLPF